MKYIIILATLFLTGCAGCTEYCLLGFGPGNKMFDAYAHYADSTDVCQTVGKEPGYKIPSWCGSSRGKVVSIVPVSDHTFIIDRR